MGSPSDSCTCREVNHSTVGHHAITSQWSWKFGLILCSVEDVYCLIRRAGNYSLVYTLNEAFWEVGGGGSWVRCQKPSLKITASSRPALHPTATPGEVRHESALLCWPTGFLAQRIRLTSLRQREDHLPSLSLKNTHICHIIWLLFREPLPLCSWIVSGIFNNVFDDFVVLF